jgi:hypothetical protein
MKSVPQDESEKKPAPTTTPAPTHTYELGPVNPATMLARQQAARDLFAAMWARQQRERQEAAHAAD